MSLVAYASSDESDDESPTIEHTENSVPSASLADVADGYQLPPTDSEISFAAKLRLPAPAVSSGSAVSSVQADASVSVGDAHLKELLAGLPASSSTYSSAADPVENEDELEDIVKPRPAEIALREDVKAPEKKRAPVKIVLPSLASTEVESSDKQSVKAKKQITSLHKCGLLAALPPPEHEISTTSLVPQSVSKVRATTSKPVQPVKQPVKSMLSAEVSVPAKSKTSAVSKTLHIDSDDESDVTNFFSLDHEPKRPLVSMYTADEKGLLASERPVTASAPEVSWLASSATLYPNADAALRFQSTSSAGEAGWEVTSSEAMQEARPTVCYMPETSLSEPTPDESNSNEYATDFQKNFNDPEFQRAFGRKPPAADQIKVIDVRLDDVLQKVDLTKNLTQDVEPMMSHSKKRNKDMPSSQQKRKHQITYLAYKAKERDLELKNQWAENKFNKRQTQSKYGF